MKGFFAMTDKNVYQCGIKALEKKVDLPSIYSDLVPLDYYWFQSMAHF